MGRATGDSAAAPSVAEVLSNSVTPWLRVRFVFDGTQLHLTYPETWLGVVRRRTVSRSVLLEDVDDVGLTPKLFPSRLTVAAGLAIAAILAPTWAAIVLFLLAVGFLLVGIVASVRFELPSESLVVPVCVLQRGYVERFLAGLQIIETRGGRR